MQLVSSGLIKMVKLYYATLWVDVQVRVHPFINEFKEVTVTNTGVKIVKLYHSHHSHHSITTIQKQHRQGILITVKMTFKYTTINFSINL